MGAVNVRWENIMSAIVTSIPLTTIIAVTEKGENDMARYIDADDLLNALKEERKNGNFVFTSKWIKEIMDKIPTADVVPKSEVEEMMIGKVNSLAAKFILEDHEARIEALMAEHDRKLASEIFAEIETLLALNILVGDVFTGKYFDADLENDLAELKKKYTKQE
jgi:hypothetical protein